jgi:hypothetical protein
VKRVAPTTELALEREERARSILSDDVGETAAVVEFEPHPSCSPRGIASVKARGKMRDERLFKPIGRRLLRHDGAS